MRKASEADPTAFEDHSGEGTVELQLLPEHARALSEERALSQEDEEHVVASLLEARALPPRVPSTASQVPKPNGAARFGGRLRMLVEGALAGATVLAREASRAKHTARFRERLRTLVVRVRATLAALAQHAFRSQVKVRPRRSLRVLIVGVLAAAAVAAIWGFAHRATNHNTSAPAEQTNVAAPPAAPAAPSAASQGDPVRIRNPFDRLEVFEFPPGTSRKEARKAVAEILLQRANERGPQLARMRHKGANHAAPVRAHDSASHQPTAH